ncbi:DHH family phosphoesterase [Parvimonas micra]|uniref:Cyclic-di-AMP phosphodiesterase n=1 Tax=Parvimonas micra TaxID=33033 RepID=A0A9X3KAA5_9FIRM|nr:DHH family phosphoesterase [Parvimonas micra]MCZ7408239.1 DHH family phosphoesterase [Parvimonas micra]MCZ7411326.1 DHH family phosphoesterase [Parvimonas micra]MCZ7412828.1 DHH family phosphoesterase [Parvimonas micra]WBB36839.1 DHH family phosphoesterase [Parvimonas micra]
MGKKLIKLSDFYVLFLFMVLISAFVLYFQYIFGIVSFILTFISFILVLYYIKNKNTEYEEDIRKYKDSLDNIASEVVYKMPFPVAVLNNKGRVKWYSPEFSELFSGNDIVGIDINSEISSFNITEVLKKGYGKVNWETKKFNYLVYYNVVKDEDNGDVNVIIYLIDNLAYSKLKKQYEEETLNSIVIYIDNYEDVRNNVKEDFKAILIAEMDKIIINYFSSLGAIIRKYDSGKYIVISNDIILQKIKHDKFSIIEKLKAIEISGNIKPTLSIGVGLGGKNPFEKYKEAQTALDMALGRGGAQIVFKNGEDLDFYGGKNNKGVERNKVKARVISQALENIIRESSEVFVMGHKNPDMDCFGAALGVMAICKELKKDCYMVLEDVPVTIRNIYDRVRVGEPDYVDMMIPPEKAYDICRDTSSVILVDNSRTLSTEAPYLLDVTSKIVVIDHHRIGKDFVENPMLTYLEPYASSACELVTEIIYYMFEKIDLDKLIAESLLAGIVVDTKNFYYQTGVRTFEMASYLKRFGADSIAVKQLFKDNFNTIKLKSNVLSNAISYRNYICIGVFPEEIEESMLIAAQAADELLGVLDIECSFVLTIVSDQIHISGRSLGKISVQLILEKLGGGGHYTSAGARLDCSMEEAIEKLKKAIDEYLLEEGIDESNFN